MLPVVFGGLQNLCSWPVNGGANRVMSSEVISADWIKGLQSSVLQSSILLYISIDLRQSIVALMCVIIMSLFPRLTAPQLALAHHVKNAVVQPVQLASQLHQHANTCLLLISCQYS